MNLHGILCDFVLECLCANHYGSGSYSQYSQRFYGQLTWASQAESFWYKMKISSLDVSIRNDVDHYSLESIISKLDHNDGGMIREKNTWTVWYEREMYGW
jgi:hypothetical protein